MKVIVSVKTPTEDEFTNLVLFNVFLSDIKRPTF